jgi:hypothetical protein
VYPITSAIVFTTGITDRNRAIFRTINPTLSECTSHPTVGIPLVHLSTDVTLYHRRILLKSLLLDIVISLV